MRHRAYIGIGGNLGDRDLNFRRALEGVDEIGATTLGRCSSVYETEPHGVADTWFLNAVAELSTDLDAAGLLAELLSIERRLGRPRPRAGPKTTVSRTIDLDLLFFDDEVIDRPGLTVPHPRISERRFVLQPMCELAPELVHPVCSRTISALLAETDDAKRVRLYRP